MRENNLERSTRTPFNVTDSRVKQPPGATLMKIILTSMLRIKFEWKYASYHRDIQNKTSIWPTKNEDRLNEDISEMSQNKNIIKIVLLLLLLTANGFTLGGSAIQRKEGKYNTVQYSTVQYSTIQHNKITHITHIISKSSVSNIN